MHSLFPILKMTDPATTASTTAAPAQNQDTTTTNKPRMDRGFTTMRMNSIVSVLRLAAPRFGSSQASTYQVTPPNGGHQHGNKKTKVRKGGTHHGQPHGSSKKGHQEESSANPIACAYNLVAKFFSLFYLPSGGHAEVVDEEDGMNQPWYQCDEQSLVYKQADTLELSFSQASYPSLLLDLLLAIAFGFLLGGVWSGYLFVSTSVHYIIDDFIYGYLDTRNSFVYYLHWVFLSTLSTGIAVFTTYRYLPHCIGDGVTQLYVSLAIKCSVPMHVVLYRTLLCPLFIALGSPLDLESPFRQVSAALGCAAVRFQRKFFGKPFSRDGYPVWAITGNASSVGCVLGSPLAGCVFAIEQMLNLRSVASAFLLVGCCAICGSYATEKVTDYLHREVREHFSRDWNYHTIQVDGEYTLVALFLALGMGFMTAFVGGFFTIGVEKLQSFFAEAEILQDQPLRRQLIGFPVGFLTGLLGAICYHVADVRSGWMPGYDTMEQIATRYSCNELKALSNTDLNKVAYNIRTTGQAVTDEDNCMELADYVTIFLTKFLACMLLCAIEAPGGMLIPSLVLGSSFGGVTKSILAEIFPSDVGMFRICGFLGMTGIFASIIRAPVTGLMLIYFLYGSARAGFVVTITSPLLLCAMTSAVISFFIRPDEWHFELLLKAGVRMETLWKKGAHALIEVKHILEDSWRWSYILQESKQWEMELQHEALLKLFELVKDPERTRDLQDHLVNGGGEAVIGNATTSGRVLSNSFFNQEVSNAQSNGSAALTLPPQSSNGLHHHGSSLLSNGGNSSSVNGTSTSPFRRGASGEEMKETMSHMISQLSPIGGGSSARLHDSNFSVTPLGYALVYCNESAVHLLLYKKADACTLSGGKSPLEIATSNLLVDSTSRLIAYGAQAESLISLLTVASHLAADVSFLDSQSRVKAVLEEKMPDSFEETTTTAEEEDEVEQPADQVIMNILLTSCSPEFLEETRQTLDDPKKLAEVLEDPSYANGSSLLSPKGQGAAAAGAAANPAALSASNNSSTDNSSQATPLELRREAAISLLKTLIDAILVAVEEKKNVRPVKIITGLRSSVDVDSSNAPTPAIIKASNSDFNFIKNPSSPLAKRTDSKGNTYDIRLFTKAIVTKDRQANTKSIKSEYQCEDEDVLATSSVDIEKILQANLPAGKSFDSVWSQLAAAREVGVAVLKTDENGVEVVNAVEESKEEQEQPGVEQETSQVQQLQATTTAAEGDGKIFTQLEKLQKQMENGLCGLRYYQSIVHVVAPTMDDNTSNARTRDGSDSKEAVGTTTTRILGEEGPPEDANKNPAEGEGRTTAPDHTSQPPEDQLLTRQRSGNSNSRTASKQQAVLEKKLCRVVRSARLVMRGRAVRDGTKMLVQERRAWDPPAAGSSARRPGARARLPEISIVHPNMTDADVFHLLLQRIGLGHFSAERLHECFPGPWRMESIREFYPVDDSFPGLGGFIRQCDQWVIDIGYMRQATALPVLRNHFAETLSTARELLLAQKENAAAAAAASGAAPAASTPASSAAAGAATPASSATGVSPTGIKTTTFSVFRDRDDISNFALGLPVLEPFLADGFVFQWRHEPTGAAARKGS
ncbi:unnamed protein product [Amoebophrya sp. A120]|nr:unnamed protein product [Amoebophrya sp. A120]|eukprot:GSA120T00022530001.1